MKHLLSLLTLLVVGSLLLTSCSKKQEVKKEKLDLTNKKTMILETSKGTIKIALDDVKAPNTTARIKELVSTGFYDGLTFHRVIPGFVIQGGDPLGNGTGGTGFIIKDEFNNGLKHDKEGKIAMAHAGPGTADCQFYITLAPLPQLDGQYTVFGEVTEGMDVVKAISLVPRDPRDKPLEPVKIIKATLE